MYCLSGLGIVRKNRRIPIYSWIEIVFLKNKSLFISWILFFLYDPLTTSLHGWKKRSFMDGHWTNKKGPRVYPGPFKKNNLFLTTARIDITTTGINITATRINNATATRINNTATGFRDFSIRTFGMFWFCIVTHTITPFFQQATPHFRQISDDAIEMAGNRTQHGIRNAPFYKNRGYLKLTQ